MSVGETEANAARCTAGWRRHLGPFHGNHQVVISKSQISALEYAALSFHQRPECFKSCRRILLVPNALIGEIFKGLLEVIMNLFGMLGSVVLLLMIEI